ncbi:MULTISPECIES: hypothetical protein [unclassified Rhodococcus (in: high G+C Gram-positive bacteria)]|uniref:hypothetical protein n=1 Tax=unclassified Rhodococcus (in: high G+C Gram-positive bacteria) TaxID=192944 RepID=UPI0009786612|nr:MULTISPECIES: hypothetical protein [unclassified Rhodococcus (in: high G+C Gram-positive bacteria)]MCC4306861.1 hypothetical protein [Rhodococcus sp. 3-2]OMQ24864.1 hypothetical protein BK799_31245 [Rhodococcus sp. D-1]
MSLSHNTFTKTAAAAAALTAAVVLVACGSDDSREAASVSTSTSGTIVTDTSTDLGSIVIGWGEQHSDAEITTPKPEDVTARCTGRGDDLAVDITAPHGWKIHAKHGSQTLAIENTDQNLPSADIDTTNKFLDVLQSVDWAEADQLDIAATTDAPADWKATHSGRVYLSVHVDCR